MAGADRERSGQLTPPAAATPGELVTWRVAARGADFEPLRRRDRRGPRHLAGRPRRDRCPRPQRARASRTGCSSRNSGQAGPGVYRAVAEVRVNGRTTTTAAVSLLVGGADIEMTDPRLNLRVLQRVAAASGGRVIQPAEMAGLAEQLRAAVPAARVASRRDLWHNGWSFGRDRRAARGRVDAAAPVGAAVNRRSAAHAGDAALMAARDGRRRRCRGALRASSSPARAAGRLRAAVQRLDQGAVAGPDRASRSSTPRHVTTLGETADGGHRGARPRICGARSRTADRSSSRTTCCSWS